MPSKVGPSLPVACYTLTQARPYTFTALRHVLAALPLVMYVKRKLWPVITAALEDELTRYTGYRINEYVCGAKA